MAHNELIQIDPSEKGCKFTQNNFAEEDYVKQLEIRLRHVEAGLDRFFHLRQVIDLLSSHKSTWTPDSAGGEPNHGHHWLIKNGKATLED